MTEVTLSNVLLQPEDLLADGGLGALWHADEGSSCAFDAEDGALAVSGLVDFCTYFNGVPVDKWRRYTVAERIVLRLEVAGDACSLATRALGAGEGGAESRVERAVDLEASAAFREVELAMPDACVFAGFAVLCDGTVRIRNACYVAAVDEAAVRDVALALCTTTFAKERFIGANIARIREGVLESGLPVARGFHMFVVDNGRTLDAEALSGGGVTVIPNPNVGGAGGFARGMMAALDDGGFTHVILMDDDVRVLPESFVRAHALLSLRRDEYAEACLNGAMLELERPTLQFEDVAAARRTGGYARVKGDVRIDRPADVVRNETADVEVPLAYGAWWFCCMPVSLIERHGLPLPFFVRCDDVEYGVRLGARYMTLSGVCVWHERFDTRFSASVVCYQYVRNMLATIACHGLDERAFLARWWRMLHVYLRQMNYAAAELWEDGLEDYLRGPGFLAGADGEALMREHGARCEKLVPLAELDADVTARLTWDPAWLARQEGDEAPRVAKLLATVPHDRHAFPDFALSDEPGVVMPGESRTPWRKTAMRRTLVALSADGSQGAVRTLDRDRYRAIVQRSRALLRTWRAEHEAVAQAWRDALPRLASREFWDAYLRERGA